MLIAKEYVGKSFLEDVETVAELSVADDVVVWQVDFGSRVD